MLSKQKLTWASRRRACCPLGTKSSKVSGGMPPAAFYFLNRPTRLPLQRSIERDTMPAPLSSVRSPSVFAKWLPDSGAAGRHGPDRVVDSTGLRNSSGRATCGER
jgi:hypothetical protein